nr:acryloyl-CoA reductase [Mycobacterium sp. OAS707]
MGFNDGVAHIRLNRPERMNALGLGRGSSRDEIADAMHTADKDSTSGCILLSAVGPNFCAGGDLSGAPESVTPYDDFSFVRQLDDFYTSVRQVRKPIVAAVNGLCLGAGMGLIAQCDLVVAADDARFGLIEGRIGQPGATELVPIIGGAWAKFLILTGELIDARRAERIGLVLTVVANDELQERTTELAHRIAAVPREAAIMNKAAVDAVDDAMGRQAGRLAGRAYDVTTKAHAKWATAPDGRRFADIIRQEGMAGLKRARNAQFSDTWLSRQLNTFDDPRQTSITATTALPNGTDMNETFTALVIDDVDGKPVAGFRGLTQADLPDYDTLVQVEFSSLNYKDGLAVSGRQKIARRPPLIGGADLAGTVVESRNPRWAPGTRVVVNGWGMSETEAGGYTRYQRVRSEWLVRIPDTFSTEQAMAIGTAGYTSALCVDALAGRGSVGDGPVLVTGAAGGVGSVAVALLAAAGVTVAASTGRASTHDYLAGLGASEIISRDELLSPGRPLQKERWASAIDTVGGQTLVNVLSQIHYGGAVAACGLAGGNDMPGATVLPYILRGVSLVGVDSVMAPVALREAAWDRLAKDLRPDVLATITTVEPMSKLPELANEILAGQIRGRVVIDVTR